MAKVLFYHRVDLRLHDSPALKFALDLKPVAFYPTFSFEPFPAETVNRCQFLIDSLSDLSTNITAINSKSKLFVVQGLPTVTLPELFKKWEITDIVWEKDDDPYVKQRDIDVAALAKTAGVKVHIIHGHTLYDSAVISAKNKGKPLRSYGPFCKVLDTLPKPAKPLDSPTSFPDPGSLDATTSEYNVPTMEDLGMKSATTSIKGGETQALEVFEDFMKQKSRVASFEKPKTNPSDFDPPSTTQLSPHLKFGTLSCRTFYHRVNEINAAAKSHSTPPESLLGQLLWREFFHSNAQIPNYNQIRGNNLTRYIDWNLQNRYDEAGEKLSKAEMVEIWKVEEPEAYEHLMAWKEGRTGFPWIDALMRQLKQEGWMHHLGRHSTACYLTRGQNYISWERGMDVYEELLVDHDTSVNAGNWMWLSASAFFVQYFRVYGTSYGQNTQKDGKLIKKYCPELAKFDKKYIYTPWLAPLAAQKAAGCIIGVDYPKPTIDDKACKDLNIKKLKASYAAKMQGDDKRVLNGTATAHVATFFVGPVVKEENDGPADHDDEDGSEDEKPKAGKRKAAVVKGVKVKAEKVVKQTKLSFKKEDSDE